MWYIEKLMFPVAHQEPKCRRLSVKFPLCQLSVPEAKQSQVPHPPLTLQFSLYPFLTDMSCTSACLNGWCWVLERSTVASSLSGNAFWAAGALAVLYHSLVCKYYQGGLKTIQLLEWERCTQWPKKAWKMLGEDLIVGEANSEGENVLKKWKFFKWSVLSVL